MRKWAIFYRLLLLALQGDSFGNKNMAVFSCNNMYVHRMYVLDYCWAVGGGNHQFECVSLYLCWFRTSSYATRDFLRAQSLHTKTKEGVLFSLRFHADSAVVLFSETSLESTRPLIEKKEDAEINHLSGDEINRQRYLQFAE